VTAVRPLASSAGRAAALVGLEGAALVVAGAGYAVRSLTAGAASVAGSQVGALLMAGSGALLLVVARGLLRRRRWALSPAVVVQLLLGLTAVSLLQTLPAAAVAGLLLAAVALHQLLVGARPPSEA
jgi:hypothetical protein